MNVFTTPLKHAMGIGLLSLILATPSHAEDRTSSADHGTLHVTKSPTCGGCGAWVSLAEDEGFNVEVTDTADVTTTKLAGDVPGEMWACHTATIDGYVVEGHVPFDALRKLLADRPDVRGIAVPGMPFGSPGMGNDPSARYDVFAFGGKAGDGEVFYRAGE